MSASTWNTTSRPSFTPRRIVAGRKPHVCCECREDIPKGVKHEVSTGKSDGMFWSFRTCLLCVEIRTAFVCGSFVYEGLWGAIEEEIFPLWNKAGPWDCLAKLTTPEAIKLANHRYSEWYKERTDEA